MKTKTLLKRGLLMNDEEIFNALRRLPEWSTKDGTLYREYKFPSFREAFGFMTQAALMCEAMNHYPEWSNINQKVVVKLQSSAFDGITSIDLLLAERLEDLFSAAFSIRI